MLTALFAESINYNIGYGTSSQTKPEFGQGVQPKETGDASAGGGDAGAGGAGAGGAGPAKPAAAAAVAGEPPAEAVAVKVVETDGPAKKRDAAAAAAAYAPPSDEVVRAAASANAVSFISEFPDTYATYCGTRGNQLSGGQKQRVA